MSEPRPPGWVLTSDRLSGVRHGFFTRRGGVSDAPYDTLNCSLRSGDLPEHILENRTRVAAQLGVSTAQLLGVTQTHSSDVVVVQRSTPVWPLDQSPKADALVTDRTDLAVSVVTADCAPVLFASEDRQIVGVAHAGWRGAAQGVLEATLVQMYRLGARHVAACVGPCIRLQSYEVGPDMRDAVLAQSSAALPFFHANPNTGRFHFDLPGYCLFRLRSAGLNRLSDVSLDT